MPKREAKTSQATNSVQTPPGLLEWLKGHGATEVVGDLARVPGEDKTRGFALATVDLASLAFKTHRYNPRMPSPPKIAQLAASIRYLSLLSPLTCCYLAEEDRENGEEQVVLVDGRHRFEALHQIAEAEPEWGQVARIDLKIYWDLRKSDIYVLSTYLNRTRRNLRKGEYYRAVVEIYELKKEELEGERGRPQTESEVFEEVSPKELADRDFDLSIGRIVGLIAFDEEEAGAWYPFVGNHQNQKVLSDTERGYCPLTAGNLAAFLGYLCLPSAYDDRGDSRSIEIANAVRLGEVFRSAEILRPVEGYAQATRTTVACKHWPLVALGSLLRESQLFRKRDNEEWAPFSEVRLDWRGIEKVVTTYAEIMEDQAGFINQYRDRGDEEMLRKAWSYQTQRDQVKRPLRADLLRRGAPVQPRDERS